MFQMKGVFSEFEGALLRERGNARLATAKAQDNFLRRPRIDAATEKVIAAAIRLLGTGIRKLAECQRVGVGTGQRTKTSLTEA